MFVVLLGFVHRNIKAVQLSSCPCLVMVGKCHVWQPDFIVQKNTVQLLRATVWSNHSSCSISQPSYFVATSVCARDHEFLFMTAITAAMRFASTDKPCWLSNTCTLSKRRFVYSNLLFTKILISGLCPENKGTTCLIAW